MPLTDIPYKIDDGDLEKYIKLARANHAAVDMVKVNRHDMGFVIGATFSPTQRNINDGDLSTMVRAALIAVP